MVSAKTHIEQGLTLYDPQQHRSQAFLYGGHDPGVCCRNFHALRLWHAGYPDQAVKGVENALALATEVAHPQTTTIALYFAALIHASRGETRLAMDKAEAALELATTHGFVIWIEAASALLGRLRIEEGRGDEGMAALVEAMARATTWRRVLQLCLLAEAWATARQPDKGLRALADAQALVDRGIGFYAPEVHRLRGELLLLGGASGAPSEAEAAFRRAIELAREREERSLELRAATSLGGLLAREGRRDEARRLLAETYGWFTEGFDTRDLKAAKALLDEL